MLLSEFRIGDRIRNGAWYQYPELSFTVIFIDIEGTYFGIMNDGTGDSFHEDEHPEHYWELV